LFCKFEDTLIGATDDIRKPVETDEFDWEAELALVVGTQVRRGHGDTLDAQP
jgi:acylpyruvate hydrolase